MPKATRAVDPCLLPHDRPCWCAECKRAYLRAYNGNVGPKLSEVVKPKPEPKAPRPKPAPRQCETCGAIVTKAARWCRPCGHLNRERPYGPPKPPHLAPSALAKARLYRKGKCHHCGVTCKNWVCAECVGVSQRVGNHRYKARKRGVPSEPYTTAEIGDRDGWRCRLCGKAVNRKRRFPDPLSPSIDHVVPLAVGGDDTRANVQLAHYGCNSAKRDRTWGNGEQLRLVG